MIFTKQLQAWFSTTIIHLSRTIYQVLPSDCKLGFQQNLLFYHGQYVVILPCGCKLGFQQELFIYHGESLVIFTKEL